MSNRLFQGIVHQMKDAIDRTIGVIDETSVVIACSELGKIGEVNESVNSETLSSTAPFVVNGYTYRSFGSNAKYDYAVFVQGTDEYAQKYLQASNSITTKSMTATTLLRMLFLTTFFRVIFTLRQENFTLTARFPVFACLSKLFQKQMFPLMI